MNWPVAKGMELFSGIGTIFYWYIIGNKLVEVTLLEFQKKNMYMSESTLVLFIDVLTHF